MKNELERYSDRFFMENAELYKSDYLKKEKNICSEKILKIKQI